MPNKPLIVCAVDLSDPRKKVCEFAKKYAAIYDATIAVLYATPDAVPYQVAQIVTGASPDQLEVNHDFEKQSLDRYIADYFAGVDAFPVFCTGKADEVIVSYAKEHQAKAIIMGTHGRKYLNRAIFGSVASRVVAEAGAIPVVTIGTDK